MADKKNNAKKNNKNVSKNVVSKNKDNNNIINKKENSVKSNVEKEVKEVKKEISEPVYNKNTKKNSFKWVLIGTLGVLLALVCFISVNEPPAVDPTERMSSWLTDTKEDQYVVTVISLTTCPHCKNYNPVISGIANEENIKLYWFDIDNMDNSSSSILTDTYTLENYTGASPYTFITKNGEFIADVVGGMGEEDTRAFLKQNGVIE